MSATAVPNTRLSPFRNLSLATWMLIAILAGLVLGYLAPDVARQTAILSTIFLRLIKSIIAPVMFGVLSLPSPAQAHCETSDASDGRAFSTSSPSPRSPC